MNREKQIEEMTKDLCDIECKGMKCNECDGYGCEYRMTAEALYTAGYRKASEVAREIFAEIEDYMLDFEDITHTVNRTIGAATFALLKKKYTEVAK